MNRKIGWVGVIVEDMTLRMANALGTDVVQGVLVSGVVGRAPADQAGLKARDVILTVNGRAIDDASALRREVSQQAAGADLAFKIVRDRREQTFMLKVGNLSR